MSTSLEPTSDRLPLKHQRFAIAYVTNHGNATQAYKDAGYEVANDNVAAVEGHRLLSNPKVQAIIQRLEQDYITSAGLTDSFVVSRWMRNMDVAMELEKPQISASNQAGELLAKHLRMAGFERQESVSNQTTNVLQINVMADKLSGLPLEELKRIALGQTQEDDPHAG